ncbi:MAG TPA: alpha/beta hydrolase [Candidatus Dormibacteraeota bacterium]|jgi:pimeloyl-ACP methyl ester carboxylesterase|nr:alpha/beta hydrolase [Candidatus Dormibacteraeota bacterium]
MSDPGTGQTTSRDGTTIGYRSLGEGPALVVLHGAVSSSQNHLELARALAPSFTVHLVDRRGRGLSGPCGDGYGIEKEVEDLDAVLTATGAHDVLGVSSGAIIALHAAPRLPAVERVAAYEPPLVIEASTGVHGWTLSFVEAVMRRYDEEMARGEISAAMVTSMKGTKMGPPVFEVLPRWLLTRLATMAMRGEERQAGPERVTMRMLAPTLHYDGQIILETAGHADDLGGISADVLLLGGSKSPAYLRAALDGLQKVLPEARRVELPGIGHAGSWNRAQGGEPEVVATELGRWLAAQPGPSPLAG